MCTLFYNANLLMTDSSSEKCNAIKVENGVITWIGSINPFQNPDVQNPDIDMKNIDLKGAYVLPGFLDSESHTCFSDFFTAVKNNELSPAEQEDWLDNAAEILKDKGISSLMLTPDTFEAVHSRKNRFLISIAEREELNFSESDMSYGLEEPFSSFYDKFESVPEALRSLTADTSGACRKLTVGSFADFSIFEKNPLLSGMKFFANIHCIRIVKSGKTIYDMEEEAENEMFALLMNQTF